MVIGLIISGIASTFLFILKNSLDPELFGSFYNVLNSLYSNLLNLCVFLLVGIPMLLSLNYLYNRNKYIFIVGLISCFFLVFLICIAFYSFQIENFSIFLLLGVVFIDLINSVENLLPFFIVLPFLIVFYYKKIKRWARYKLTNLKIRNHILVIDDGRRRKFKALIILQIQNIPRNIVVKEERYRKKSIEKLMIPGTLQYLHYHLTSLARIIPNIKFEIRVIKSDIKIRIILSSSGSEINEVMDNIEVMKDIVITVFQTTFPGLKFEILEGSYLKSAWEEIFGGWGNYRIKFVGNEKVLIDKVAEKTYISILKFENVPNFKNPQNKTQIDSLIRGLIGANFELNYIISAEPLEIYDFEKQIHIIEKKAKKIGFRKERRGTIKNIEFRGNYSLINKIEEEKIREELLNIRHAEITGIWNVSGYIVVRSDDNDKLDNDIQRIKALISTIFGIEISVLKGFRLKRGFSAIPMRSPLFDPLNMTSEQLAIFLHLPEDPIPSLSRIDIPEFEIPPERRIFNGISIGKVLFYDQELYPFQLRIEELRLNVFICGLIGMGKTRLAMNILRQLTLNYPNINWICLDWKGEYQYLLNEIESQNIVVLIPGSEETPVKLNMFDPHKSNTDEHARKLFAIIREVFKSDFNRQSELSSQMESVCKEVLRRVVKNPKMRNLDSFIAELRNYAREEQSRNRTIMMTVTALINRFDRFKHGVLKKVFDVKRSNIDFDILMERKVIVNLNHLLTKGGAKEDVRLVMNLFLKYIIDKALGRGITDDLKHIVIIEDAQFLIPSVFREVPETSLVEDIPLLLRGVGESLITIATRPEVSSDIIANSGVKITFKCPYDSQKIAKYQNLSEIQEKYLRTMPKREAIVTLPNFQFPFRIVTDYFEIHKHSFNKNINEELISMDNHQGDYDIPQKNGNLLRIKKESADAATFQECMQTNSNNSDLTINSRVNQRQRINSVFYGNNMKEKESQDFSYLEDEDIDFKNFFSKIRAILETGPKNKRSLSKELAIPLKKLDTLLKPLLEEKLIFSRTTPIFNKKSKQKLYILPEDLDYIEREIKLKLENDFLNKGKIGKLPPEDTFDYIWYGTNTFIKIVGYLENTLEFDKVSKILFDWFEEAVERESFELIIIVPFYDWGETIRHWLKTFRSNQILVFAYYIDDWKKLGEYLENGITPTWISDFEGEKDENTSLSSADKMRLGKFNRNILEFGELSGYIPNENKLPVRQFSNKNMFQNNGQSKKILQREWIKEIRKRYKNKYSLEFLKRFNNNYLSASELAEELGCTIQNVETCLGGLVRYLKWVEISDLYDPVCCRQRFYGWKNERLGQQLMKREFVKLFTEKEIEFTTDIIGKDVEVLILKNKELIYFIFQESEIDEFTKFCESQDFFDTIELIIVIVHGIELKNRCERIFKKVRRKIELFLYDWAEIGPFIRKLACVKPT